MKWSKACALLAYLITIDQAESREFLADLLWDAVSTSQSLQNLRKLLSRMRQWVPELEITRQKVAYRSDTAISIDYQTVICALESGSMAEIDEALRLYKGDLLKGFYLNDAPRFNEWLLLEREQIRQRVAAAYRQVCFTYTEQKAWEKGINAAQRWHSIAPYDEESLRNLMQMLASYGQVEFALQQYALSRQQLLNEIGVEPEQSTLSLAQQLTRFKEEAGKRISWTIPTNAQIVWPEPDDLADPGPLPPLSTVPYQRNPDFTGRHKALLYLAKMLVPWPGAEGTLNRVVAITGMGGLGKTQLAVEFCYRYGRYFPGGVFWFSFADPQTVAAEIAASGGERGMGLYREDENFTLSDQVGQVQRAWQEAIPRLLIFDNCEEAALLTKWLPVSGGCRVLLTSRRANWARELKIAAWPMSVLDPTESVDFLRQLAPALGPADAGDIAVELGHLPLALHLAGRFLYRYPEVSTVSYLSQLRARGFMRHPSLMGRGISYSPTGHRLNVLDTFTKNYELLDPTNGIDDIAQQLLARAACFAPNTQIPIRLLLATIISDELEMEAILQAKDGLDRLVTLGFLKLEGPESVVIHRLVAAYVHEISATTEEAVTSVGNMLLKVLTTSLDQQGHLGRLPIAANHLHRVTNLALSATAAIAVSLSTLLGHHLRDIADYDGARKAIERAIALPHLTDNKEELAKAWIGLARVQRSLGQDQESLYSAEQAEHLLRTADRFSSELLAHVLQRKGWSLFMLGRAEEAITAAEEALALCRKANLSSGTISNLNLLGEVHFYLREHYDLAIKHFDEALEIARNIQNLTAEGALFNNLGEIVERQGDFEKALQLYQKAMSLAVETDNKDKELPYRANLGRAQVLLGAYDQAVDCLEDLIDLLPQKSHLSAEINLSLAGAYLGQGRLDLAVIAAQHALTKAGPRDRFVTGQAWAVLGRISAQMKAPLRVGSNGNGLYDASACFRRSLEVFSKLQSGWGRAMVLSYWSEVESLQGDKELGEKMRREAWDIFTRLNLPLMTARLETGARAKSQSIGMHAAP